MQLITRLMEVSRILKALAILNCNHFGFLNDYSYYCWFEIENMQLVSESEKLRMKKLEELSKNIETVNIA